MENNNSIRCVSCNMMLKKEDTKKENESEYKCHGCDVTYTFLDGKIRLIISTDMGQFSFMDRFDKYQWKIMYPVSMNNKAIKNIQIRCEEENQMYKAFICILNLRQEFYKNKLLEEMLKHNK